MRRRSRNRNRVTTSNMYFREEYISRFPDLLSLSEQADRTFDYLKINNTSILSDTYNLINNDKKDNKNNNDNNDIRNINYNSSNSVERRKYSNSSILKQTRQMTKIELENIESIREKDENSSSISNKESCEDSVLSKSSSDSNSRSSKESEDISSEEISNKSSNSSMKSSVTSSSISNKNSKANKDNRKSSNLYSSKSSSSNEIFRFSVINSSPFKRFSSNKGIKYFFDHKISKKARTNSNNAYKNNISLDSDIDNKNQTVEIKRIHKLKISKNNTDNSKRTKDKGENWTNKNTISSDIEENNDNDGNDDKNISINSISNINENEKKSITEKFIKMLMKEKQLQINYNYINTNNNTFNTKYNNNNSKNASHITELTNTNLVVNKKPKRKSLTATQLNINYINNIVNTNIQKISLSKDRSNKAKKPSKSSKAKDKSKHKSNKSNKQSKYSSNSKNKKNSKIDYDNIVNDNISSNNSDSHDEYSDIRLKHVIRGHSNSKSKSKTKSKNKLSLGKSRNSRNDTYKSSLISSGKYIGNNDNSSTIKSGLLKSNKSKRKKDTLASKISSISRLTSNSKSKKSKKSKDTPNLGINSIDDTKKVDHIGKSLILLEEEEDNSNNSRIKKPNKRNNRLKQHISINESDDTIKITQLNVPKYTDINNNNNTTNNNKSNLTNNINNNTNINSPTHIRSPIRRLSKKSIHETNNINNISSNNRNKSNNLPILSKAIKRFETVSEIVNYNTKNTSKLNTFFGVNCSFCISIKKKILALTDSISFIIFIALLSLFAITIEDIKLAFLPPSADFVLDIFKTITLVIFVLETLCLSCFKDDYFNSFLFYMDLISTISLILDIDFIYDNIIELFDTSSNTSDSGGAIDSIYQNYSKSDNSKYGNKRINSLTKALSNTRIIRIIRLIRIVRLVRLVKLYKSALLTKKKLEVFSNNIITSKIIKLNKQSTIKANKRNLYLDGSNNRSRLSAYSVANISEYNNNFKYDADAVNLSKQVSNNEMSPFELSKNLSRSFASNNNFSNNLSNNLSNNISRNNSNNNGLNNYSKEDNDMDSSVKKLNINYNTDNINYIEESNKNFNRIYPLNFSKVKNNNIVFESIKNNNPVTITPVAPNNPNNPNNPTKILNSILKIKSAFKKPVNKAKTLYRKLSKRNRFGGGNQQQTFLENNYLNEFMGKFSKQQKYICQNNAKSTFKTLVDKDFHKEGEKKNTENFLTENMLLKKLEDNSHNVELMANESRISKLFTNTTIKKIMIMILFIMTVMPVLDEEFFTDDFETSPYIVLSKYLRDISRSFNTSLNSSLTEEYDSNNYEYAYDGSYGYDYFTINELCCKGCYREYGKCGIPDCSDYCESENSCSESRDINKYENYLQYTYLGLLEDNNSNDNANKEIKATLSNIRENDFYYLNSINYKDNKQYCLNDYCLFYYYQTYQNTRFYNLTNILYYNYFNLYIPYNITKTSNDENNKYLSDIKKSKYFSYSGTLEKIKQYENKTNPLLNITYLTNLTDRIHMYDFLTDDIPYTLIKELLDVTYLKYCELSYEEKVYLNDLVKFNFNFNKFLLVNYNYTFVVDDNIILEVSKDNSNLTNSNSNDIGTSNNYYDSAGCSDYNITILSNSYYLINNNSNDSTSKNQFARIKQLHAIPNLISLIENYDSYFPLINITINNHLVYLNENYSNIDFRSQEVYYMLVDGIYITYLHSYDIRLSSILFFIRTFYILIITIIVYLKLEKDIHELVIHPLEVIMEIVDNVSKDPANAKSFQSDKLGIKSLAWINNNDERNVMRGSSSNLLNKVNSLNPYSGGVYNKKKSRKSVLRNSDNDDNDNNESRNSGNDSKSIINLMNNISHNAINLGESSNSNNLKFNIINNSSISSNNINKLNNEPSFSPIREPLDNYISPNIIPKRDPTNRNKKASLKCLKNKSDTNNNNNNINESHIDRHNNNKALYKNYEVIFVQKALIKITSLLAVGIGEAGANIIKENLQYKNEYFSQSLKGKKVYGIFGFVGIKNFNEINNCLQEHLVIYLNKISKIVHTSVDKFLGAPNKNIGEAYLCCWKLANKAFDRNITTIDMHNIADCSVLSFLDIIKKLRRDKDIRKYIKHEQLKKSFKNKFETKLNFGLHVGWSIEGGIGSSFKVDFSYLSPNVNISSRLETAAKFYQVELLISGVLYNLLSPEMQIVCRKIDIVMVKGSKHPIELYTIDLNPDKLSLKSNTLNKNNFSRKEEIKKFVKNREFVCSYYLKKASFEELLDTRLTDDFYDWFEDGLSCYIKGDWKEAKKCFIECMDIEETDGPTKSLFDYMQKYDFIAPSNWSGVRELNSK